MVKRSISRAATGLPRYFMDTGWWRARRFAGLPLESIGLMSCVVGYCTEHSTDGHLPADHEDLAAALGVRVSSVRRAITGLLERGVLETKDGELVVVGWEDHNPTRAEVEAYMGERSTLGSKGNHKRWHLDRDVIDPDCPWCRSSDRSTESEGTRYSDPKAIADGSHGMGWDGMGEPKSSSNSDSRPPAQPVEDDPAAAIDALARADLARRESEKGPVGNPDAWLASARAGHRRKADADPDYLTRRPTLTAVPTPLDGTVAASRAVMERNARRNAGQACDDCSDSGWLEDASGTVSPCHCSWAAS